MNVSRKALGLFALGVALVVVTGLWSWQVFGTSPSQLETRPGASLAATWRSFACIAIAACFVAAMFVEARARGVFDRPASALRSAAPMERLGTQALLAFAMLWPLVLLIRPHAFTRVAVEDGPVETGSAVLLALACVSALALVWQRRKRDDNSRLGIASIAIFGLLCFLVAGEEVSWLQRVFKVATPEAFAANEQFELNLHNFATSASSTLYIFVGGFVALVLVPAARALSLPLGRLGALEVAMPPAYLLGLGAVITGYNANLWAGIDSQVAYWSSVFALAGLVTHLRDPAARRQALVLLAMVLLIQPFLLLFAGRSSRPQDVSEYKEFLIAASFFLWSLSLWRRPAEASVAEAPIAVATSSLTAGRAGLLSP